MWYRSRPQATCHPDRLHWAKGLCATCYKKYWKTPAYKKRECMVQRKRWLKKRYNISEEMYSEMLVKQHNVCLICKQPPTRSKLHIDHNHQTGKVRGLLCSRCNTGIGLFRENPMLLTEAVYYLQKDQHDLD